MLTFAAAVSFLIITPGPGVLSTAGVASGFGPRSATRYVMGLFICNNVVAFAVISGLGALVLANAQVRAMLFAISLGYLCYLAYRIAFAGSKIGFINSARPPGIRGGITLQIILLRSDL